MLHESQNLSINTTKQRFWNSQVICPLWEEMSRYWSYWCLCLTWRCSHSLTGNCYKFDLCSRVLSELRLLICYDARCKVGASDATNNLFHCISGTQANPAHIHTLLSTYLPTRVCENKSRHALDAGGVWACRFLYVKRELRAAMIWKHWSVFHAWVCDLSSC